MEGRNSVREVSQSLSINRTTLSRYIKKKQKLVDGEVLQRNLNTKQVFNEMEENDLSRCLRACSDMFHGLTSEATRTLAFQYAECNSKDFPDT